MISCRSLFLVEQIFLLLLILLLILAAADFADFLAADFAVDFAGDLCFLLILAHCHRRQREDQKEKKNYDLYFLLILL